MSAARQALILGWTVEAFGAAFGVDNIISMEERALRFAEEALETVQAAGLNRTQAMKVLDRVFSRPPGDLAQEIGSSLLTLEGLAEAAGIDADAETDREFARIQAIPVEEWTRRHSAKQTEGITS